MQVCFLSLMRSPANGAAAWNGVLLFLWARRQQVQLRGVPIPSSPSPFSTLSVTFLVLARRASAGSPLRPTALHIGLPFKDGAALQEDPRCLAREQSGHSNLYHRSILRSSILGDYRMWLSANYSLMHDHNIELCTWLADCCS